jgi:hypothetical protein
LKTASWTDNGVNTAHSLTMHIMRVCSKISLDKSLMKPITNPISHFFAIFAICSTAALYIEPVSASVTGAACPSAISENDCVANDLQPTGSEVVNGPSACTEGDIFSATVRILFDEGGGANTRYNIGFYVGEAGESAIGGDSCTFDSLQPIGDPPFPLGGPFAELNGDFCGDIEKSEPTYKDIELLEIECKDDDGDGNVDISYVLTWENNANQASCSDPLDPLEFEPRPPKCLSDLEYDLPIAVEDPPSMDVAKGASPATLEEPGGIVRFPITIINTSPSVSDPLTIKSILDEVEGVVTDITNLTDCAVPFTLAPSQSRTCYYTDNVDGNAGDMITDTVTVLAQDDEGETVQDSDSTTVTIIAKDLPPPPGDLRLVKFVSPSEIDEPGGTVQYDVLVANLSPTPVELTSLEDDLYGDLNGKGNCSVPQTLSGQNSIYFCAFEEQVSGEPGDVITDTITASGIDNLPTPTVLFAKDSASVTIDDVPSDIEVTKVANTEFIPEPGGEVTFSLQIQNTSVTDVVTIDSLFDSQLGEPKGDCTTGFSLNPGEVYSCSYAGLVSGNAGDTVTNVILVRATDDDGVVLLERDAATVVITGQLPDIEVRKIAVPQFIPLAGGTATYVVAIQNVSTANDPVTITSLEDEVNGNVMSLDGEGTCDLTDLVLQPAPGDDSYYICSFTQTLPPGNAGDTAEDTVTAGGVDDEGFPAEASDNAIVTYVEVALPEAQLEIAKIASPFELPEPGGDVTFSVFIANDSDPENPNLTLTLNALDDDIYGDLFSKGNCDLLDGITLAPQEIRNCSFTETLIGVGDEVKTDTIVATATDLLNRTVQASDSASVTILDLPASIRIIKTAYPNTVVEPGEDVTFSIRVLNTSQADVVVLDSLIDNVHGDLIAQGLCPPPGILQPGRDPYRCSFTAFVGGPPGFEERNTVTAFGTDADGETVEDSGQASVTVLDQPPSITALKTAIPDIVPTQGDTVTFTVSTTNTSSVDEVTLDTLQDSVFGNLNGRGDCSVPQVLPAGDSYTCSFDAFISGNDGETHANEFVVTGTSDDGDPVAANAQAIVTIPDQLPSIEVAKFAVPPFVPLAGGTVNYVVAIQNVSSANDPVTITRLVDEIGGIEVSLDQVGTCDLTGLVLQPAPADDSSYICSFTQDLPAGSSGDTVEDTVTASGEDDEGDLASASDNAIVRYVEAPPEAELEIAKFASPFEIQEPGGTVTFSVIVTNASDPAFPGLTLTLTSLQDDIYGNLFVKDNCNLLNGIVLAPDQSANCSFTESVNGVGGDVETDTIIAMANDVLSRPVQATASASVTILDLPASLLVSKTASPTTVIEPGDDVTFEVVVSNASQADVVVMESLIDDVHGDLVAQGLCPPPGSLLPGGDSYRCEFTAFVGGPVGFRETNTVTASGRDDKGNPVQAIDQATVTVLDQRSSISASKSATPNVIPATGGTVTFSFTTTNTSRADGVVLDSLLDSVFGDLNGQGDCSVPQALDPGDTYTCSFNAQISGNAGDTHVNQFVVTGASDTGDPVTANAIAIVLFREFVEARDVTTLGRWGLGLLVLLLGLLGFIRGRTRTLT